MIKKTVSLFLALVLLLSFAACSGEEKKEDEKSEGNEKYEGVKRIVLAEDKAYLDGEEIKESDYTWHVDPSKAHDEVKNAPAEYYTGTKEENLSVYIDHELYYYPALDPASFVLANYDGEREYLYYYTDGVNDDYIFATLPLLNGSMATYMMHTEEEAMENKVLHIKEAGTYSLEGTWNGQIYIDLGEDAFSDENAKVTVILNGASIKCSVAPGIIFKNAYECDNQWEERSSYTCNVNTENAGVCVIIADDSENTVTGTNVFRMLKTKLKDETSKDSSVPLQKKMRKTDGALYSYVSMNIAGGEKGNGKLTVNSDYEGVDSELHLSVNGGNLVINCDDDGINVNEDGVSVFTLNGGNIVINSATGKEGDGIDSNGFAVINGGSLSVKGVTSPDSAVDTDKGVTYNGGTVTVDGQELNLSKGSTSNSIGGGIGGAFGGGFGGGNRPDMGNMQGPGGFGGFGGKENREDMSFPGRDFDMNFDMKEFKKKVNELPDDGQLSDVLALLGYSTGPINDKPDMKQIW